MHLVNSVRRAEHVVDASFFFFAGVLAEALLRYGWLKTEGDHAPRLIFQDRNVNIYPHADGPFQGSRRYLVLMTPSWRQLPRWKTLLYAKQHRHNHRNHLLLSTRCLNQDHRPVPCSLSCSCSCSCFCCIITLLFAGPWHPSRDTAAEEQAARIGPKAATRALLLLKTPQPLPVQR